MTLHLPNLGTSPPGSWRYRVPETGQHFLGSNWPELQGQLMAHYKAAGYPVPDDLFQRVEAYICAGAQGYCVEESTGQPPRNVSGLALTFHTALQGTRTLIAWLGAGRTLVSPEQSASRAAVCALCNYNQEPQGCTACNNATTRELVERLVGKRTTPSDGALKACLVCHCHLKAKVHLPHAILWKHMTPEQKEQLPGFCWLISEAKEVKQCP